MRRSRRRCPVQPATGPGAQSRTSAHGPWPADDRRRTASSASIHSSRHRAATPTRAPTPPGPAPLQHLGRPPAPGRRWAAGHGSAPPAPVWKQPWPPYGNAPAAPADPARDRRAEAGHRRCHRIPAIRPGSHPVSALRRAVQHPAGSPYVPGSGTGESRAPKVSRRPGLYGTGHCTTARRPKPPTSTGTAHSATTQRLDPQRISGTGHVPTTRRPGPHPLRRRLVPTSEGSSPPAAAPVRPTRPTVGAPLHLAGRSVLRPVTGLACRQAAREAVHPPRRAPNRTAAGERGLATGYGPGTARSSDHPGRPLNLPPTGPPPNAAVSASISPYGPTPSGTRAAATPPPNPPSPPWPTAASLARGSGDRCAVRVGAAERAAANVEHRPDRPDPGHRQPDRSVPGRGILGGSRPIRNEAGALRGRPATGPADRTQSRGGERTRAGQRAGRGAAAALRRGRYERGRRGARRSGPGRTAARPRSDDDVDSRRRTRPGPRVGGSAPGRGPANLGLPRLRPSRPRPARLRPRPDPRGYRATRPSRHRLPSTPTRATLTLAPVSSAPRSRVTRSRAARRSRYLGVT